MRVNSISTSGPARTLIRRLLRSAEAGFAFGQDHNRDVVDHCLEQGWITWSPERMGQIMLTPAGAAALTRIEQGGAP